VGSRVGPPINHAGNEIKTYRESFRQIDFVERARERAEYGAGPCYVLPGIDVRIIVSP
jgi:hypothetical protein